MTKQPDAFRTISEVADQLDLPQHVLRFWETRFKQIKPMKRGGGRRYYRPEDVELLQGIKVLLYSEGYTIKGVQRILKEQGVRFVCQAATGDVALAMEQQSSAQTAVPVSELTSTSRKASASSTQGGDLRSELDAALSDLLECKRMLDQAR